MIMQCPNCEQEFSEHFENYFRCSDCGWFQYIDDQWRSVPEPKRISEPDLPEPEPPQPPQPSQPPDPEPNLREYLGGLVTVEIEDYEDEEND